MPARKKTSGALDSSSRLSTNVERLRIISYVSLVIAVIALGLASYGLLTQKPPVTVVLGNSTNSNTVLPSSINVTGSLITPSMSLSGAPVITTNQSFGNRLTNINAPLNESELSIFNNASDQYFITAGEMYLNHTLANQVGTQASIAPILYANGKPSVVYLGAISCIFCAENRWSMALALGKFGSFNALFKGYSALQDQDAPTLFWAPAHYNSSTADLGNFYQSNYINFVSVDYASPITQGFQMQSLQYFISAAANNTIYSTAMQLISKLNNFQGTPYTIWGKYSVPGADAVAFGNTPPQTAADIQIRNMTHEQMLASIANPTTQLAWTEYAGADLYIAMLCASMNNTSNVHVCSLPVIQQIEQVNGYSS